MKIYHYFTSIVNWLVWGPKLWWLVVFILFGCFKVLLGHKTEPWLRGISTALQMCGLIAVVIGIFQTQAQFHLPGPYQRFLNWLQTIPGYPRDGTPGTGGGSISVNIGNSTGYSWRNTTADSSLAERIAVLEQNLSGVNERLDETRDRLSTEKLSRIQEMKLERSAREESIRSLAESLESAQTGGLDLALAGTVLTILGTILGGVSIQSLTRSIK